MRSALQSRLLATNDIHFMPEYEMIRRTAGNKTTAHQLRKQEKNYPFKRVLAAASLSGAGADAVLAQLDFLKDPDATVRYWAAIGLDAQGPALRDLQHKAALLAALDDPHPCVQIAAAAAAWKQFAETRAADLLKKHILGSGPHTVMLSLQMIEYMGGKASEFYSTIKTLMSRFDPNNDDGRDTTGLLKQRTYEIKSLADIILHNASNAGPDNQTSARSARSVRSDRSVHSDRSDRSA
jgi:hypothetical protein